MFHLKVKPMRNVAFGTWLRSVAERSPHAVVMGVHLLDRTIVVHWPTLWQAAGRVLHALLGLDAASPWIDARLQALTCLPGRPVVLTEKAVAEFLDGRHEPSDEYTAFTRASDPHFLGLLPDRATHHASLQALTHWLRQLIYAIDDLADVDSHLVTGVWRDMVTDLVVVRWALRVDHYPFGHPDAPQRALNEDPLDMPARLIRSADVHAAVSAVKPRVLRDVIARSPWATESASCNVVDVQMLAQCYAKQLIRPAVRIPTLPIYRCSLDPDAAQLPAPLDVERFKEWVKAQGFERLHFQVVRRRKFAVSLPHDIFLPKASLAENILERDRLIAAFRAKKKEGGHNPSSFYPTRHIFEHLGVDYYTAEALKVLAVRAPRAYYVFEALRNFLESAELNPTAITGDGSVTALRVADRQRAPRWSADEDHHLRKCFHKNPERRTFHNLEDLSLEESFDYWSDFLFKNLHESHRTRPQVMARIATLNNNLKRDLVKKHGRWSAAAKEVYEAERLGQRNRRSA